MQQIVLQNTSFSLINTEELHKYLIQKLDINEKQLEVYEIW